MCFAIVMTLAPFGVYARPPSVVVPAQRTPQGLYLVEVRADDGPYTQFAVDTGATRTCVDPRHYHTGAPVSSVVVHSVGGSQSVPEYQTEIEVGTLPIVTLRTHLCDMSVLGPEVGGILGRDFLLGHVTDFDPYADTLTFDPRSQARPRLARATLKYQGYGSPLIEVRVAHHRASAVLDTGAAYTTLNAKAAAVFPSEHLTFSSESTYDSLGNELPTFKTPSTPLSVGKQQIYDGPLHTAAHPGFASSGLDEIPMMLLGMDVLGHHVVRLDLKRFRVTFLEVKPPEQLE